MKPYTYAVLKYMTTVTEASVDDVMEALKADYSTNRQYTKANTLEVLMAANKNGLLEETRYEFDNAHEVRVFFKAPEDAVSTINSYIK